MQKVVPENKTAARDVVFNRSTGSCFREVNSQKHRPAFLLEDLPLSNEALAKLP